MGASWWAYIRPRLILGYIALFLWVTKIYGSRLTPSDIPQGPFLYGKCRLLINEINLFPNSARQFIEFKKICDRVPDRNFGVLAIDKFKLLFIDSQGYLIAVCQLKGSGSRIGNDFFYVIGGSLVPTKNMAMEDCHFAQDASETSANRFPVGNELPVGVMLVHNQKLAVLRDIDLNNDGTTQNPVWKKVKIHSGGRIMSNLQDMVIVTAASPYTSCKFFDLFFNGYLNGDKKILRDWGHSVEDDVGLSRCPIEERGIRQYWPFQMSMFATAKRTAGDENDCTHSVRFFIEDLQPPRKHPRLDFSTTPGHECEVTTDNRFIEVWNMIDHPFQYSQHLKEALKSTCGTEEASSSLIPNEVITTTESTSESDEETYVEDVEFTPLKVDQSLFETQLAEAALHNWQDCNRFEPKELIEKLKRPIKQLLDWEDIMKPDTCNWFEWIGWVKPPGGPTSPRFKCKICNRLLSQGIIIDRPGSKWITKVMKSGQGIGGKCAKPDNRKIIRKHLINPLHRIALDFLKLLDEGLRGDDLMKKFKEQGRDYHKFLEATEKLFIVAYQAVRLDVTFFKFNILRELLDHFGVNTGHLYANAHGMKTILVSISDTMHNSFVEYLKSKRPEFSLLVDLSTDIAALPAAAFVFQTYDDKGGLQMKLYRVIHLRGETGEDILQDFMHQIRIDGLESYLEEKLVGFASDSGSNVLKFRELLQEIVDHALVMTKCQAHRIENAHKAAWKSEPYLSHVDDVVNDVHRIFHRSAKKKRVLMNQQQILGDRPFDVKRYHKVRWVASKKRALQSLLNHWKTILSALEEISTDRTFERSQREDAEKTITSLKDPVFISTLAFSTDVFEIMSPMSLDLQYRGTTLIGKRHTRERIIDKLQGLINNDGDNLKLVLLASSQATEQDIDGRDTTLYDFETGSIEMHGIPLFGNHGTTDCQVPRSPLHTKRTEYIERLVSEIRKRFPTDPTDDLDVFDTSLWPTSDHDLQLFGNTRIRSLNTQMKWNYPIETLLEDWKDLKLQITRHPEYQTKHDDLPEDFWTYFLANDAGVSWPESFKTIVSNIITAPSSSAEVERIFSFYTSTKTVKRYCLDVSTVDAIIRVKFNGPKSLAEFHALDFLPNFLKTHARSDDEIIPSSRKSRILPENQDLGDEDSDDIIDVEEV